MGKITSVVGGLAKGVISQKASTVAPELMSTMQSSPNVFKEFKSGLVTGKATMKKFFSLSNSSIGEMYGSFTGAGKRNKAKKFSQYYDEVTSGSDPSHISGSIDSDSINDTSRDNTEYLGNVLKGTHNQTLFYNKQAHMEQMTSLSNITNLAKAISDFQMNEQREYFQNSLGVLQSIDQKLDAMIGSKQGKQSAAKGGPFEGGNFNIGNYWNMVKGKASGYTGMLSMLNFWDLIPMMLSGDKKNPHFSKLNDASQTFFVNYLSKMRDWKYNGGMFKSLLGSILAPEDSRSRHLNLGSYKNNAIDLEVENKKVMAITEVIPRYLSEITAKLTGKDIIFNYASGRFENKQEASKRTEHEYYSTLAGDINHDKLAEDLIKTSGVNDKFIQYTIKEDSMIFAAFVNSTVVDEKNKVIDPFELQPNDYEKLKRSGLELLGGKQSFESIIKAYKAMPATEKAKWKKQIEIMRSRMGQVKQSAEQELYSKGYTTLMSEKGHDSIDLDKYDDSAEMRKLAKKDPELAKQVMQMKSAHKKISLNDIQDSGDTYLERRRELEDDNYDEIDKLKKEFTGKGLFGILHGMTDIMSTFMGPRATKKLDDYITKSEGKVSEWSDKIKDSTIGKTYGKVKSGVETAVDSTADILEGNSDKVADRIKNSASHDKAKENVNSFMQNKFVHGTMRYLGNKFKPVKTIGSAFVGEDYFDDLEDTSGDENGSGSRRGRGRGRYGRAGEKGYFERLHVDLQKILYKLDPGDKKTQQQIKNNPLFKGATSFLSKMTKNKDGDMSYGKNALWSTVLTGSPIPGILLTKMSRTFTKKKNEWKKQAENANKSGEEMNEQDEIQEEEEKKGGRLKEYGKSALWSTLLTGSPIPGLLVTKISRSLRKKKKKLKEEAKKNNKEATDVEEAETDAEKTEIKNKSNEDEEKSGFFSKVGEKLKSIGNGAKEYAIGGIASTLLTGNPLLGLLGTKMYRSFKKKKNLFSLAAKNNESAKKTGTKTPATESSSEEAPATESSSEEAPATEENGAGRRFGRGYNITQNVGRGKVKAAFSKIKTRLKASWNAYMKGNQTAADANEKKMLNEVSDSESLAAVEKQASILNSMKNGNTVAAEEKKESFLSKIFGALGGIGKSLVSFAGPILAIMAGASLMNPNGALNKIGTGVLTALRGGKSAYDYDTQYADSLASHNQGGLTVAGGMLTGSAIKKLATPVLGKSLGGAVASSVTAAASAKAYYSKAGKYVKQGDSEMATDAAAAGTKQVVKGTAKVVGTVSKVLLKASKNPKIAKFLTSKTIAKLMPKLQNSMRRAATKLAGEAVQGALKTLAKVCFWIQIAIYVWSVVSVLTSDARTRQILELPNGYPVTFGTKLAAAVVNLIDEIAFGLLDIFGIKDEIIMLIMKLFDKDEAAKLSAARSQNESEYQAFLQKNNLTEANLSFEKYNKMQNRTWYDIGGRLWGDKLSDYEIGGKKNPGNLNEDSGGTNNVVSDNSTNINIYTTGNVGSGARGNISMGRAEKAITNVSARKLLNQVGDAIKPNAMSTGSVSVHDNQAIESDYKKAKTANSDNRNFFQKGFDSVKGFFKSLFGGGHGRGDDPDYYSQLDPQWGNNSFGMYDGHRDTVADGGCGPTTAAMMFQKMTGTKITPGEMANDALSTGYKYDNDGTDPAFFGYEGAKYGINMSKSSGIDGNAIANLQSGRPVALMGQTVSGNSPFGSGSHYVLATGMDKNGNVNILDPQNRSNNHAYNINDLARNTITSISPRGRNSRNIFKGRSNKVNKIKYSRGRNGRANAGNLANILSEINELTPVHSNSQRKILKDEDVKNILQKYGGVPYNGSYGGMCAQFMEDLGKAAGIDIPCCAGGPNYDNVRKMYKVDKNTKFQPGAIIYLRTSWVGGNSDTFGHVGIYLGETDFAPYNFIHTYSHNEKGIDQYPGAHIEIANLYADRGNNWKIACKVSDEYWGDLNSTYTCNHNNAYLICGYAYPTSGGSEVALGSNGFSKNSKTSIIDPSIANAPMKKINDQYKQFDTSSDGMVQFTGTIPSKTIYNALKRIGYDDNAAYAILGNISSESGSRPNNVGDNVFPTSGTETTTDEKAFLNTMDSFISKGKNVSDTAFNLTNQNGKTVQFPAFNADASPTPASWSEYAYGLPQFSHYSLREGLYNNALKNKNSLSNYKMQLNEISSKIAPSDGINGQTDLKSAVDYMLCNYERPRDYNYYGAIGSITYDNEGNEIKHDMNHDAHLTNRLNNAIAAQKEVGKSGPVADPSGTLPESYAGTNTTSPYLDNAKNTNKYDALISAFGTIKNEAYEGVSNLFNTLMGTNEEQEESNVEEAGSGARGRGRGHGRSGAVKRSIPFRLNSSGMSPSLVKAYSRIAKARGHSGRSAENIVSQGTSGSASYSSMDTMQVLSTIVDLLKVIANTNTVIADKEFTVHSSGNSIVNIPSTQAAVSSVDSNKINMLASIIKG